MIIKGQFVDLFKRLVYPAAVTVQHGKIIDINPIDSAPKDRYIMPGFVDAHVHIESSMLVPSRFAELAIPNGTVATVSDPHEIANVLGREGVEFMVNDAAQVPLKIHFGVPSCVPATPFETSGATLDAAEVEDLLQRNDMYYLAEMMNYPGVIYQDQQVMKKIAAAHNAGKPVDGHAPGISGDDLERYASAGITTDHEAFSENEALEKIAQGMKIQIREGSAAKNYRALASVLKKHPASIMFCTDDCHPDDLLNGHINATVKRAIAEGYDLFDTLSAATINAIAHYKLPVGRLQIGDPADFIVVEDLTEFTIKEVYINGEKVYTDGKTLWPTPDCKPVNRFISYTIPESAFSISAEGETAKIIKVKDGELVTSTLHLPPKIQNNEVVADLERDILKIAVINRYSKQPVQVGLINGFGLKQGAFASSIAHDSHNIIVVGADDESMHKAVAQIMKNRGGIAVIGQHQVADLPLPVAGLMSTEKGHIVAAKYQQLDALAKQLGCSLKAPFMTLAFMALLVIPDLKIGDKGLFDGTKFAFTSLWDV